MNETIGLIKRLGDTPGVSGCEHAVREEIISLIKDCCDSYMVDALGNLLVFKKGAKMPKRRMMLSAHMDEVGLIITHIEDDGLLRFANVGGIDPRVLFGKAVEIGPGRVCGVIGGRAVHHLTENEMQALPEPDKLAIDIGASDKQQAEEYVSPGDCAVFSSPCVEVGEDYLLGRAFDDRAGCALLVQLLRSPLPYDCHFAFTAQEETGCTGAQTASYTIAPEIGIAVETTTAGDIAGVPPDRQACKLGGGAVISFMDRGTVYDKELYHLALDLAEEKGIKAQAKTAVAGANDSQSIQKAKGGARVMAISIPCRYLHSPSLLIHKDDVTETYKMLAALIEKLGGGAV